MLCNVLAVFQLCSPLVLKQVGTPCWDDDDERHSRGQVPWWLPRWGAGVTTWDVQIDTQLAVCVARPPRTKGVPDSQTAPWIFFRLHECHEPAWPWRAATHRYTSRLRSPCSSIKAKSQASLIYFNAYLHVITIFLQAFSFLPQIIWVCLEKVQLLLV